jgi:hypothetical protein
MSNETFNEKMKNLHSRVGKIINELENLQDSSRYDALQAQLMEIGKESKDMLDEQENSNGVSYVPYPEYEDPNFNRVIYSKKEFRKHAYAPDDTNESIDNLANDRCNPSMFMLTPNQMFLRAFMSDNTPYRGILLYHGTGVGKTCSAITLAEQHLAKGGSSADQVLVLLPSNLKENFKRQICDLTKLDVKDQGYMYDEMQQCTGSKYINMVPEHKILNKKALEGKVAKLVTSRYKFHGFLEFANKIQRMRDDIHATGISKAKADALFVTTIQQEFSNRLIIIDEVHNLRNEVGASQFNIMNVLRYGLNNRLVLMTATPMFNSATEFVPILNMLLTNDKRNTITEADLFAGGDLTLSGTKLLRQLTRGYVSYMRGENPFSFPTRLYPSINNDPRLIKEFPKKDSQGKTIPASRRIDNMEIVASTMSPAQQSIYSFAYKEDCVSEKVTDELMEELEMEDENHSNVLQRIIQISNIVYPTNNGEGIKDLQNLYSKRGFFGWFSEQRDKPFQVSYKKGYEDFLSYERINKFAPKLKTILDYISNSTGIVYVYSYYIYGGILPLAIALEHMGFTRLNQDNLLANNKQKKKKGKVYTILSRTPGLSSNIEKDIELIRSTENTNGETVKVILGTSVSAEGIDFKCLREIHLLEPWYHLNKVEQIIGRGIRNCSHMKLPLEHRNVTIYHHANTLADSSSKESIDLKIYRMAVNKQRVISKVESIVRNNAVDCHLNKEVLYYDEEKNFKLKQLVTSQNTYIKDFPLGDHDKSRRVKCDPLVVSDDIDSSTYHVGFLNPDIGFYTQQIVKVLNDHFHSGDTMTYQNLKAKLSNVVPKFDEDVFQFALDNMINRNHPFEWRGERGYLLYRSNKYIFQSQFSRDTHQSLVHKTPIIRRIRMKTNDVRVKQSFNAEKTIEMIEAKYTALGQMFTNPIKLRPFIIDAIIDSLEEDEFMDCCILVTTSVKQSGIIKEIKDSLNRGHVMIDPDIFFIPHQGQYLQFDNNEWNVLATHDMQYKVKPEKHRIREQVIQQKVDVIAFVSMEGARGTNTSFKKSTPMFKLVRHEAGGSTGTGCFHDPKVSKLYLKNLIQPLSDRCHKDDQCKAKVSGQVKQPLCQIYEILVRAKNPNQFARPYDYLILKEELAKSRSKSEAIVADAKPRKPRKQKT